MSESRIHIEGLKPTDVALMTRIAEEASNAAVRKILVQMGIDPDNPMDAQRDMVWLRATRMRCEGATGWAAFAVISLVIGSIGSALVVGIKSMMNK